MRFPCLLILLALVPGAASAGEGAAEKKELERLKGVWEVVNLQYNGKDIFAGGATPFDFEFVGDEAIVQGNDKVKKEYARLRLKLIPGFTPCLLDLTVTQGIQKDAKMEGIYDFKDGQLRLCVRVFGTDRPTEFNAPAGSSIALLVLRKK